MSAAALIVVFSKFPSYKVRFEDHMIFIWVCLLNCPSNLLHNDGDGSLKREIADLPSSRRFLLRQSWWIGTKVDSHGVQFVFCYSRLRRDIFSLTSVRMPPASSLRSVIEVK